MDAMTKMWVSFIGIGLMVLAVLIVTFARLKTKGIIRFILTAIAFVVFLGGILYGFLSII